MSLIAPFFRRSCALKYILGTSTLMNSKFSNSEQDISHAWIHSEALPIPLISDKGDS